jgi:hypothetical protein
MNEAEADAARRMPQCLVSPAAWDIHGQRTAAAVMTPYGSASREAVDGFPAWTQMAPLAELEPFVLDIGYACPFVFWSNRTGGVSLVLNVPGQAGMLKPILDLPQPQPLWWDLARARAGLTVLFFPTLRDPLGEDIAEMVARGEGFGAWARRVAEPNLR